MAPERAGTKPRAPRGVTRWGRRAGPRPTVVTVAVLALVTFATPAAAATRVLVVDDDGQQCPQADTATLGAALLRARDGDRIRVCPGTYAEAVTVERSVTIQGPVGPVTDLDCRDSAPSTEDDLDPTRFAVVRAPEDLADGPLVRVAADDVLVSGLVLQGRTDDTPETPAPGVALYDAALSVGDTYSGTRLRHNLFRLNTLAVELGGSGERPTRADHNCFRDNDFALANQRYPLRRARVDDNIAFRTRVIAWELGWSWAGVSDVRLDHNVTVNTGLYATYISDAQDVEVAENRIESPGTQGVTLQQSQRVRVTGNEIAPGTTGIYVGGGIAGVEVLDNRVVAAAGTNGGVNGILADATTGLSPTSGLVIRGNEVTGMQSILGRGIGTTIDALPSGAVIADNVVRDNIEGIALAAGNQALTITGNRSFGNTGNGIRVAAGARENLLTDNVALGNTVDARDGGLLAEGQTPTSNRWVRTTCVVDVPAGQICVPPAG